jgi:hypothetical protein
MGIEYSVTTKKNEFESWENEKINYSYQYYEKALNIYPANLLFESEIKQQNIEHVNFRGINCLFSVYKKSDIPFDVFAASFYLVSRYEEYLPYKKDPYDRFSASESISFQLGFLHFPVVNIWAEMLKEYLSEKFPSIKFGSKKYKFIPTIDIDSAFAYKQKGFFRSTAGILNSLVQFDFKEISERLKVLFTLKKDPFDTFELQFHLFEKYKLHPIYFILYAEYGKLDKNIHVFNPRFQSLIKSISDQAEVGIHPSFSSNTNIRILEKEISRLSGVLNKEVKKSRQHFLKLSFPYTYRNLLTAGIAEDYTMGYASQIGFRAGICDPFNFYDLDLEYETQLRVYSFAVMEGTLKDYLNLSALDVINYVKPLIESVKKVNGTFICLWHNESLSNQKRWIGWHKVFEEMLQLARP